MYNKKIKTNKRMKYYRLFLVVLIIFGIGLFIFSIEKSVDERVVETNNSIKEHKVYAVGLPVGLYLHTKGVMVLDIQDIETENGKKTSPAKGLIEKNDYITEFNGIKVYNKTQLQFLVDDNEDKKVKIKFTRNGVDNEIEITPIKDIEGEYKIGIWIRDDAQGIGTMTYITKKGEFGALGHGVSDIDTGRLLDSEEGKIYQANMWGIKKGKPGEPGGLCGSIEYNDKNIIGNIQLNCNTGLYGRITNNDFIDKYGIVEYEVGNSRDINVGSAEIQMIEEDRIQKYDIKIEKIISKEGKEEGKDFVIKITDSNLIKKTNGIVQGMSGSPIVQNGRIVGAVTHVLVNDPTRGYGIFIENMLEHN